MLTNSESDSEAAPSMALELKESSNGSRQVRKRNKALQVRFKDICEAQSEQATAARETKPATYKVAYRKYMTVPARRSIPNVTKSTGVQTSPDLKKRYQTFPLERKKGQSIKHAATVETCKDQDNGYIIDVKRAKAGEGSREEVSSPSVQKTQALMHTNECIATIEHNPHDTECAERTVLPCPANERTQYQVCSVKSKHRKSFQRDSESLERSRKWQLSNSEDRDGTTLPGLNSKVTGPIAWNSLTQVECLESPSARSKRKKTLQINGLQSQTLPRTGCTTQVQCHAGMLSARPIRAMEETPTLTTAPERLSTPTCEGGTVSGTGGVQVDSKTCKQIVPVNPDKEVKAQMQAMESMISSSQETIKVLLGVIQELEKGEALREG